MECFSEEMLFHFLHELPFLKKKKEQMFNLFLDLKKHLNCCINVNFFIQFLYFFIKNTQPQFYLSFLEQGYFKLSLDLKIDTIIYLSYNSDMYVDIIINFYNDLIQNIFDIKQYKYICFIDSIYYKTVLDSKTRNIKYIPDKIILNNIEKCFEKFENLDKIKCLDKIVSIKELSEKEIEFLESLLKNSEYIGRVIDIFLKTNNILLISKAYSLIYDTDTYYESKNAVHFFKLSDEFIEKIHNQKDLENKFIISVHEFIELSKKISLNEEEINNNSNLIKFLMISNYKLQNINISNIFTYCWLQFNNEEKLKFIEEMSSIDNDNEICGYGIIVNMVSWLNYFDYGNNLIENENEIENKIKELKKIYPDDHDIWMDPEKINNLL